MIKYIFVAPDGAVTQLGEYPNVLSAEMLDAMMYNKFKFIYEQFDGKFSQYTSGGDGQIIIVVLPKDQVTVAQSSVLQNPVAAKPRPSMTEWKVEEKLVSTNLLGAQLAEMRRNIAYPDLFNSSVVKYVLLTSNKLVRYLMASDTMPGTLILEQLKEVYPEATYTDWFASEVFGNGTDIPISFVYHHSNDAMAKAETPDLYKQIQYTFYSAGINPELIVKSSFGQKNGAGVYGMPPLSEHADRAKLVEASPGVLDVTVNPNINQMQEAIAEAQSKMHGMLGVPAEQFGHSNSVEKGALANTEGFKGMLQPEADATSAYKGLLEWEEKNKQEIPFPEDQPTLHFVYEGASPEEAAAACAAKDALNCWRACNNVADPIEFERYLIYDIPNDKIIIVDTERGSSSDKSVTEFVACRGMSVIGRGGFYSKEWQGVIHLNVVSAAVKSSNFRAKDESVLTFMERYDSIMKAVQPVEAEETNELDERLETQWKEESKQSEEQFSRQKAKMEYEKELIEARKKDQEERAEYMKNMTSQTESLDRIAKTMETMLWEYMRK